MLPCVTEVKSNDPVEKHTWLFERVEFFQFDDASKAYMRTDALLLNRVTIATVQSTGHKIGLKESEHCSFIAPINGVIGVETSGKRLSARSGESMLLMPGYRNTFTRADTHKPFQAIMALGPAFASPPYQEAGYQDAAGTNPAHRAIGDYLRYLIGEFSQTESPLKRPAGQMLADALLLDLFSELHIDMCGSPLRTPSKASLRQILAAEEIMRARTGEPLTIELIAQEIGVSVRALQTGFRRHRDTTPRAALSTFRLSRARELLLMAGPSAAVAEIALECGFAHFGRFANTYRARYGEPPSETLRRAKR